MIHLSYEKEVGIIADAVSRYLAGLWAAVRAARKAGETVPDPVVRDYGGFRTLLRAILIDPAVTTLANRCCAPTRQDQDEFLATAAMCALGPGGKPPKRLWVELLLRIKEILDVIASGDAPKRRRIQMPAVDSMLVQARPNDHTQAKEDQPQPDEDHAEPGEDQSQPEERDQPLECFVFDITVALGCGKWRTIAEDHASWEGIWRHAHVSLVIVTERVMRRVLPRLALTVPGFPAFSPGPGLSKFAWDEAYRLVSSLLTPPRTLLHDRMNELSIEFDGSALRCVVNGELWHQPSGLPAGARFVVGDSRGGRVFRPPGSLYCEIPAGGKVVALARDDGAFVYVYWVGRDSQVQTSLLKLGVDDPVAIELPSGSLFPCGCGRFECAEQHRLASSGWDLYSYGLASCAAVAVKGPSSSLVPGAFVQGLYADILTKFGWA